MNSGFFLMSSKNQLCARNHQTERQNTPQSQRIKPVTSHCRTD